MKILNVTKHFAICALLLLTAMPGCMIFGPTLVIQAQESVEIELIGYNGLIEIFISKGDVAAGGEFEIDTAYRGFALLVFSGGQGYPLIIGDELITAHIAGPGMPPTFTVNSENEVFYKALTAGDPVPAQYNFASLMIQAKQLLESNLSLRTIEELHAKKQEYHEFVVEHYDRLKHSDMVRRLIAQYFMMHEYVDYHVEGAPATDIRVKYQQEVLNGIGSWLDVLSPHIPRHEILNYCVSLYYNRSMVTLASVIVDNFKDVAYCPGDEDATFTFPDGMIITDGYTERKLAELNGDKIIAFVSVDCPVSMVETVSKARQLADEKQTVPLLVAATEKLSYKHLVMNRMIRTGKLLFVSDEKWRTDNLTNEIKLPLFIKIEDGLN